jgi:phosphohistidine phosphatase
MELYIIRHAWAAERDTSQWPNDDLRPLTAEGRKRFGKAAKKLLRSGVAPGVVATSPLLRCLQTAEILAAAAAAPPATVQLDELRPGGSLERLVQWTVGQSDKHDKVAWVGHAPDVGRLAAALIGQPDGRIRFAKAAAAAISFDGRPSVGGGELQWLVTAKILGY